jgi:uncharacterized protein
MTSLSQGFETAEDAGSNTTNNITIGEIIATRFSRRDLFVGALAVTAVASILPQEAFAQTNAASFNFKEIAAGSDENHHVAEGYDSDILIRWGDKVMPNAPEFVAGKVDAKAQSLQFGYNNDYIGYIPINGSSTHGLLVVNHEYTNEELIFAGLPTGEEKKKAKFAYITKDMVDMEMMAHGGSVLEVKKENGKWAVVNNSQYARRITPETTFVLSGPAAGNPLVKTHADPMGKVVRGTLNNCAGGVTPWGTWLMAEENFNGYFWGKAEGHPQESMLKRYGAPANWYAWGKFHDRFDIVKEPNEMNRFGWIVEVDPFDPLSTPVKRTALGRFKHEGAEGIVNKDKRYVVYTGDDERFDYAYKFVTKGVVTGDRLKDRNLLDEGTLYVARYNADGTGEWLPLVYGQGVLTQANGFNNQGEVLIFARKASDLLGATKMDRPEDFEANPKTGKVYLMLTNNTRRSDVDPANPRKNNRFGHIIEMSNPDNDHAATKFTWNVLVRCGDPAIAEVGATFNPATTKDGWFGMPDMCAIDADGRLWIGTDGQSPSRVGHADGLYAMETEGALRGTSKLFFRCPNGAEMCGPVFTPDGETLFLAVQHPGEGDEDNKTALPATFENPTSRWPDFKANMPPRPSIVVVTKKGGGKIA